MPIQDHDNSRQRGAFIALMVPTIVSIQLHAAARMLEFGLLDTVKVHSQGESHITLRYIGDTSTANIESIMTTWSQRHGQTTPPFQLHPEGIGTFPDASNTDAGNPYFVWAGVGGDTKALREIQAQLETIASEHEAPPPSFNFTPHITIARIEHRPLSQEQETKVQNVLKALRSDPPFHQEHSWWTVNSITALAQNTGRSDTKYRTIATVAIPQDA